MQVKDISAEGHTSYLVYSTDTQYKEEDRQKGREDSNYYSTLKYRQKLTDEFDNHWFNFVFENKPGKIRGVW